MKKSILGVLAVFILWTILDYVLHGVLLQSLYRTTAAFWRPEPEIKTGLMSVVTLIASVAFVGIYACLITPKSIGRALRYGFLFGLGSGVSMGYGTYSVMPIPYALALAWFLGTLVEVLLAAALIGVLFRDEAEKP